MFLVDTNVWLERLLDQDRTAEVGDFLDRFPSGRLFMTDFALHSIFKPFKNSISASTMLSSMFQLKSTISLL
jgi:hypothetical protein